MTGARSGLLVSVLLGGLLVSGLPSAGATPVGDARARAAQLRQQVDALRVQAEIATEDYDAAYAELGAAVTAHLTAEKDLQAAEESSSATDGVAARRVRALYMSGGVLAQYATVLESADIVEVGQRVHEVDVVLAGDRSATRTANDAVARREDAERRLAAAARTSTALQKTVAARADHVRDLLARADALLAEADARVVELAEQQRQAAEAAAAARAATALAQAVFAGPDLPAVDASPKAALALAFASEQLGEPYLWGATGPDSWDCSGLTGAAWAAAGVQLPRTSREQWNAGPHVALADLQPGDLLFWGYDPNDPSSIHHVALYAGDGMILAAPHSGDVVKVQPLYLDGYLGAVRPGATLSAA